VERIRGIGAGVAATLAAVLCAFPSQCGASCLELPTTAGREVDNLRYANPVEAVHTVETRLADPGQPLTVLERTELQLVRAFALIEVSRIDEARTALAEAQGLAASLPAGPERRRIELRLAMASFGVSFTQASLEQGRNRLDELVRAQAPGSIEWTCLLVARGDFEAELDHPDLAVADQLASFRAARGAGWVDAEMTAAFALATSYRRSSLWSDAHAMVDQVIAYATTHDFRWYLAIAQLTSGQIYSNERRWNEAYAALASGEELALKAGDPALAAFATGSMCSALLGAGRIDEARGLCAAKFAAFVQMGRTDLAAESLQFQARIDLHDRQYAAALARLDRVLAEHADVVPPRTMPALYRDRATALAGLARYREAAADLERSIAAQDRLELADRQRTAAVLSGIARAQALESANEDLSRQNRAQQRQLDDQRRIRSLGFGLAAAGLAASLLLAGLLLFGARQRRALARHAAVLDTMGEGVMVIDAGGRITLANAAMHRLLGYAAGSLPGMLARALGPVSGATEAWDKLLAGEARSPVETPLRRFDGTEVLAAIISSPMPADRDGSRICVCRDISGQRRVERAVADASGREALQVSGTLHEGLAQELAGVAMLLGSLAGRLRAVDEAAGASAREVAQHLAEAIRTARTLAQLLSPIRTTRGSLGDALRSLATETGAASAIPVSYGANVDAFEIEEARGDELYRIARDALGFALHQRQATRAGLDLDVAGGNVRLRVSWECRGAPAAAGAGGQFDLDIMTYRVRLLGGSFELIETDAANAAILVCVPLGDSQAAVMPQRAVGADP
jgi:PAS domain S-box-containing protein